MSALAAFVRLDAVLKAITASFAFPAPSRARPRLKWAAALSLSRAMACWAASMASDQRCSWIRVKARSFHPVAVAGCLVSFGSAGGGVVLGGDSLDVGVLGGGSVRAG